MTLLVGILNITPDSFTDGGRYATPETALARAQALLAEGAAILDIGAESTRPGAAPLAPEEEWQRLHPVLEIIRAHLPQAQISLDTRHAETIRNAAEYHPAWINDVSGFSNPAMLEAAAESTAQLVVMHSLGIPADKKITLLPNCNPVEELLRWAEARFALLEKCGITRARLIFDPGIGFGKTPEQSLVLIRRISAFRRLGVPILVGHSEKSFLARFTDTPAGGRGVETQVVSAFLMQQGVEYLRVHDVAGNRRAFAIAEALA